MIINNIKRIKNNIEVSISIKVLNLLILTLCSLCFSILVFANNFSDDDCKSIFIGSSEFLKHLTEAKEVKQCIAEGRFIDQKDIHGRTALQRASDNRNEDVKMLLENGASVKSKDNCEITALMYAYIEGNYEIAKMLLEKGANPYEIYLIPHLVTSCSFLSEQSTTHIPYSCEYMEDLLDSYKDQKVRYKILDRQIDETKLAWIVDRRLYEFESSFGRIAEFIIGLFELTSYGKAKLITISGTKIKTNQEYIPTTMNYGSLLKHVAIKFYNGSIFSYSDDNRILESKGRGLEFDRYYNYANRNHGGYEIGFDAALMNKAIEITREKWDIKGERWDGNYFDVENHNCHNYLYDDAIKVYLGLGGILYIR